MAVIDQIILLQDVDNKLFEINNQKPKGLERILGLLKVMVSMILNY